METTTGQTLSPTVFSTKPKETFWIFWKKFFLFGLGVFTLGSMTVFFQERSLENTAARQKVLQILLDSKTDASALKSGISFLRGHDAYDANAGFQNVLAGIADQVSFSKSITQQRAQKNFQKLFVSALYFANSSDFEALSGVLQQIESEMAKHKDNALLQEFLLRSARALARFSGDSSFSFFAASWQKLAFQFVIRPEFEKELVELLSLRQSQLLETLNAAAPLSSALPEIDVWTKTLISVAPRLLKTNIQPLIAEFSKSLENVFDNHDPYVASAFLDAVNEVHVFEFSIISENELSKRKSEILGWSGKILKRAKVLLEENGLDRKEGKKIIVALLTAMRNLKTALPLDDINVLLFEADERALQPFFAFLFSPEFEGFHGSFEEEFSTFLTREKEASALDEVSKVSRGAKRKGNLSEEAKALLIEIGVDDGTVEIIDLEPGWVSVKDANFAGQTFSGNFNPQRKLFTNLVLNGEAIGQSVSLDAFPAFALSAAGKLSLSAPASGNLAEKLQEENLSTLEKVLVAKVIEKLTVAGFSPTNEQVHIQNMEKEIAEIEDLNIALPETPVIKATFEFSNVDNTVTNVQFDTVLGRLLVAEKFPVSNLFSRVNTLIEKAKVDKANTEKNTEEAEL